METQITSRKKPLTHFGEFELLKAIAILGLPAVHIMEEAIEEAILRKSVGGRSGLCGKCRLPAQNSRGGSIRRGGLIAYAEEAFIVTGDERERLLKEAGAIAAENDLFMLICLDYEDEEGYLENEAIFIDSEGHQISEYDIYKVLTPMWTIFVAIVLADLIRIVITQIRARKARRNSAAVSE